MNHHFAAFLSNPYQRRWIYHEMQTDADDLDVNAKLVKRGAAWVYRKYAKDPALFDLKKEAQQAERGIWSLPEAERQPPWEWRRR